MRWRHFKKKLDTKLNELNLNRSQLGGGGGGGEEKCPWDPRPLNLHQTVFNCNFGPTNPIPLISFP